MSMRWVGVTARQYDAVREIANWEQDTPDGAVLHAAWFDEDGLHVTDVWSAQENFERFVADRLMPAVKQVGVVGEPEVHYYMLHRRFVAPGVSGGGS